MVFTGTSITDFYTLKTQKNTPVTVNYLLKKKYLFITKTFPTREEL